MMTDALTWAGTFHGIGARLLRDIRRADRARPGLHDPRPRGLRRPDEPGAARARLLEDREPLSRPRARASRSIRAASMPRRRSRTCCGSLSLVRGVGSRAAQLFAAYVEAKQRQNVLDYDDLLLYWAQMVAEPGARRRHRRRGSTTCWSTSTRTPTACSASILLALKPDGRGLTVVGDDAQSIYSFRAADGAQHPRFPRQLQPAGRRSSRSTGTTARRQPILAAANARHRTCRRALHQEPLDRPRLRPSGRSSSPCATRPTRRATSSSACWRTAKAGIRAEAAGGAVPRPRIIAGRSRWS